MVIFLCAAWGPIPHVRKILPRGLIEAMRRRDELLDVYTSAKDTDPALLEVLEKEIKDLQKYIDRESN